MISVQNENNFLIQSSPGNVISLPQLRYKGSHPNHTIQVLNIQWAPPLESGELNVIIKVKNPFLLKISNNNNNSEEIVTKLNKAYSRYAKTDNLFELLDNNTIYIRIDQGDIYTNTPILLRKKYEQVDDMAQTELPEDPFLVYNAKPTGNIEEPETLRNDLFFTEPVISNYRTQPIPDNIAWPKSIMFGFKAGPATEESFVFPLKYFSSLFPLKVQNYQLAQEISAELNKSNHAQRYGWNFDISLNEPIPEFMCERNTYKKILFKSWFRINEAETSPILKAEEYPSFLRTYMNTQMIIPPVNSFLVPYKNPFTLHLQDGIENSAWLNQHYEKVIALFEIHSGAITILFSPRYPVISSYAINRIPIEIKDASGRKLPGEIKLHLTLT